jgi:hypothetical protein
MLPGLELRESQECMRCRLGRFILQARATTHSSHIGPIICHFADLLQVYNLEVAMWWPEGRDARILAIGLSVCVADGQILFLSIYLIIRHMVYVLSRSQTGPGLQVCPCDEDLQSWPRRNCKIQ